MQNNGIELENRQDYYLFKANSFHAVYGGKTIKDDFIQDKRIMKDYGVYVVVDGAIHFKQDNLLCSATKGEMLLQFPYIEHGGFKRAYSSFYWFHFTTSTDPIKMTKEEIIEKLNTDIHFFDDLVIIPHKCKLSEYTNITLLINLYLQSLYEKRNQECENSYINLLLSEISRQELIYLDQSKTEIPLKLIQIIEYIDLFFSQDINVKELSKIFGYNSKYLSYLFKKFKNISPKKYLENVRMNHADSILIDTSLNLKEVSSLVGYSDSNQFVKAYKKSRGITPTEFRKNRLK